MTIDRVSSINTSRVLHSIYTTAVTSRPELSRELGMDRSTVSKIVNLLVDRGIVLLREKGTSTPRGGRRPEFLQLNPDAGHVIGVELQTDQWFATGIDLQGDTVFSLSGPIGHDERTIADALGTAAARTAEVSLDQATPLLGSVVAAPGIVDPHRGVILRSNPLNLREPTEVGPIVRRHLDATVLVENDANACCWGELMRRKHMPRESFACVLMEFRRTRLGTDDNRGVGVGIGMVVDGHVHYGSDYSAGEFQSVFRRPSNVTQFSASDEDALRITSDRDILSRVFDELSVNLGLIVNIMNLQEVVLVGDLSRYRLDFAAMMQTAIQNNWSYDTAVNCSVRVTELGRETVAYGAAAMFIERLFSVPGYHSPSHEYTCGIDLFDAVLTPKQ